MSDREPEHEYERPSMSPVSRYYYDLYYSEDNLSTIITAACDLVESLPFDAKPSIDDIFDVGFISHELDSEPRIAKEMLVMMPFLRIAPHLEKSNCGAAYIKQWYMDAVKGAVGVTKDDHNLDCFEYDEGSPYHISCSRSARCPHRFLERYLTDAARHPDFTSKPYQRDPLQAMAMATVKMQVAKECQVVLSVYGEAVLTAYDDKCQEFLEQMISRREVNANDILQDRF